MNHMIGRQGTITATAMRELDMLKTYRDLQAALSENRSQQAETRLSEDYSRMFYLIIELSANRLEALGAEASHLSAALSHMHEAFLEAQLYDDRNAMLELAFELIRVAREIQQAYCSRQHA